MKEKCKMKFLKYIAYLYLIYGISFNLVAGQSDCTKLLNLLNGDTEDYGDSCCVEGDVFIKCDDEGYITSFSNAADEIIDLPSFPHLSRIEHLNIVGIGVKEIPNNIFKLTSLKTLNFYINKIEVIPPDIQNLSNLEVIMFEENNIKEIPKEIYNLKNLKKLYLGKNDIEIIPPGLQKLSKLEELYLHDNKIKELPNEIFNLQSLRSIYINGNPISNAKIVKFGNKSLVYCDFSKIDIKCYEPNTCKTILLTNSRKINDDQAQKEFKMCTREEIDTVLTLEESKAEANIQTESENNLSQGENKNNLDRKVLNRDDDKVPNFPIFKAGIALVCIIIIFTGILVTFILIKKNKTKKHKRSYINLDDDSIIEKYIKNIKVNNNNNTIGRVNNIRNSTNFQNNINPNNSIMLNLNDMIKEIHRGGSYSSYSSYGFSSFSLQ